MSGCGLLRIVIFHNGIIAFSSVDLNTPRFYSGHLPRQLCGVSRLPWHARMYISNHVFATRNTPIRTFLHDIIVSNALRGCLHHEGTPQIRDSPHTLSTRPMTLLRQGSRHSVTGFFALQIALLSFHIEKIDNN